METNRLVQFRVVVECGNLRKASELLAISHSGLSKSMKALESDLGLRLFHPSGRGIVASDDGRRLYDRSEKFLAEYQILKGQAPSLSRTVLRVGSFETFTSFFIGPLLRDYLQGIEVEIHETVPGRLEEALVFDKIDVGITYEPVPRKGIEYVQAASLLMGAYARPGRFEHLALERVPFITPVSPLEGAPSGVKGRDGWPDESVERNVAYRVDSLATGLEIARQGLAAIFIPRFVARLHNERAVADLRLEPLKLPRALLAVKRDMFVVRRESTAEDDRMRQIARALKDIC